LQLLLLFLLLQWWLSEVVAGSELRLHQPLLVPLLNVVQLHLVVGHGGAEGGFHHLQLLPQRVDFLGPFVLAGGRSLGIRLKSKGKEKVSDVHYEK
jgi:hypothetical protein